jgi:hypothetical protein
MFSLFLESPEFSAPTLEQPDRTGAALARPFVDPTIRRSGRAERFGALAFPLGSI